MLHPDLSMIDSRAMVASVNLIAPEFTLLGRVTGPFCLSGGPFFST
jgi:hypothetical protein